MTHSIVCPSIPIIFLLVYCAKTAEPVEMAFGLWTRVAPRKHVLDGGQIPRWCQCAIIGWHIGTSWRIMWRRCGLMSNYFDHLLALRMTYCSE